MKVGSARRAAFVVLFLLDASAGSTASASERRVPADVRAPRSSEHTPRDSAAVLRTIEASARAFTEFTKTRSIESVLAFYAKDFTGIENGQEAGLDTQRELLEDLRDQMTVGANVGLSLKASNIEIRVTGPIAWATYDYLFRIASADGTWDEEEGKCSSVLEKSGAVWLFKHEHCSSVCPDEGLGDDSDVDPLRDRT